MTNEQAIEIIRKEYKCVDRDCDIERSCGKCELSMPNKGPILQAYKMAIQALEQEPICGRDCEHCTWTECLIEPCTDAVSREEVKKIVDFYTEQYDGIFHVNESIDKLPSVTQKSGHWIPIPYELDYETDAECSLCHEKFIDAINYDYCPKCGYRMRKSEDK